MFQTPWLPEFLISLNDFKAFEDMYRGKKLVSVCTSLPNID